jgi:hypothetical protein
MFGKTEYSDDGRRYCVKQLTVYFFDVFHIHLSLDGAWIFEMYMKCKCKSEVSFVTLILGIRQGKGLQACIS